MQGLRELDEAAYLRFASVYQASGSAEDFEREIQMLRMEQEVQGRPARADRREATCPGPS